MQPEGFNNTIHWHVGHMLTVAEQFMFGFPKKSESLPANYMEFFATGTKPADWHGEVPSVQELSVQLQEQLNSIKRFRLQAFLNDWKNHFSGKKPLGKLPTLLFSMRPPFWTNTSDETCHRKCTKGLKLFAEFKN